MGTRSKTGKGRAGRGGSKHSKPILTSPHGARLKSHPITAPPSLQGGENPHGAKRGQVKWDGGKIVIPNCIT